MKKTIEERRKEFEINFYKKRNDCIIVGEYTKSRIKIDFKCKTCNKIFSATPNNMLKETYGGCPECAQKRRTESLRNTYRKKFNIDTDIFKKKVESTGKYTMIPGEEYISNKIKVKLHCNICNNDFSISPVNFDKGKGCPECYKNGRLTSKGVEKIEDWLMKNNFKYEREVTYDDLKCINNLFFDFIVYNNDRIYAIEFDGEQHFFKRFEDDGSELEKTKKRDEIKNLYCESNNIPLLRIKYNEINLIKSKLRSFLK